MVNNIASLRGKVKERLRDFIARVHGFNQNLRKETEIIRNRDLFDSIYPNSFHCLVSFVLNLILSNLN